jgi:hypothetical protein
MRFRFYRKKSSASRAASSRLSTSDNARTNGQRIRVIPLPWKFEPSRNSRGLSASQTLKCPFVLKSRHWESEWAGQRSGPAIAVRRQSKATCACGPIIGPSFSRASLGPPSGVFSAVRRFKSSIPGGWPPGKPASLVMGLTPFFADSVSFCSAEGGSASILLCYKTVALPL